MENFYKGNYKGSPQEKANERYRNKDKEKSRYLSYRRQARLFIRSHATLADLDDLEMMIANRKKDLENVHNSID